MSPGGNRPKLVRLVIELDEANADALAQFVKRIGHDDIRQLATDDHEAYRIKDALIDLRKELAARGFAPR